MSESPPKRLRIEYPKSPEGTEFPENALCPADPHFWQQPSFVTEFVLSRIRRDALVLEIGSGHNNFPRADVSVDIVPSPNVPVEKMIIHDCCKKPLPFPDKTFDFVYCRHTLEDTYNPFLICSEMSRVGRAGYIETPSPIVEMCRGVDAGLAIWRGYNHHRFIIWSFEGVLHFLTKFPLVEFLDPAWDKELAKLLRGSPQYWNTHHLWTNQINMRHLTDFPSRIELPQDYPQAIRSALQESGVSCDAFYQQMGIEIQREVA